MASNSASSSAPAENDKPVVVRIKRKAHQSRLDAFWLEISERPLKKPLLDFDKLSISDSSTRVEELKSRKVFVQHVETVTTSEIPTDILNSFASNSEDGLGSKGKNETRRIFKTENKQNLLLSKAKQQQEMLSKNARFEQIWRSRKEKKECARNEALNEMCRLYDVVRVEVEEKSSEVNIKQGSELEDCRMMSEYLPLLREVLPSAAAEVEADIYDCITKGALPDNFVYDYYAVRDDMDITEENAPSPFPLVQVDDEDYYDGPDDSEYETDDSNAEDNPLNDYPDEESSDIEDDSGSRCSDDKSETESRYSGRELEEVESTSQKSSEPEIPGEHVSSDGAYPFSEDDIYDDYVDWEVYDDEGFNDVEECR